MTFCRKCWTSYTEATLPAECPHIDGPYRVIGGVPRSEASLPTVCECGCNLDDDGDV